MLPRTLSAFRVKLFALAVGVSFRSVQAAVNDLMVNGAVNGSTVDGAGYGSCYEVLSAEPVCRVSRIELDENPNGEREEL